MAHSCQWLSSEYLITTSYALIDNYMHCLTGALQSVGGVLWQLGGRQLIILFNYRHILIMLVYILSKRKFNILDIRVA